MQSTQSGVVRLPSSPPCPAMPCPTLEVSIEIVGCCIILAVAAAAAAAVSLCVYKCGPGQFRLRLRLREEE